uniref:Uncharacterized protein n=1 Tax=Streptomyces phage Geonosis TaxID=3158856 RepID=A0AAU7GZG8_9CAUD
MKTDPTVPTQRPATPDSATPTGNCLRWPHMPPHCGCPAG